MSNPYREIFSAPGAIGFSAAAFFARLPIAMAPVGIVAMLAQTHGEYWLAGAVSATFALTNAFISPQISRLVDRYGQSRIVMPATVVSVIAFAFLLVATKSGLGKLDIVRFGIFCRCHAQHPGHGKGKMDGNFPQPPRTEHRFRVRVGGG